MHRFVIWWILSSIHIYVLSNRVCTPPHNLPLFQQNTFIFNSTSYLTFHDLYAIQCVQTCMKSSPCKTISFNLNNGTCQLYHKPSSQLQQGNYSNFVTTDIQEWPRHLAGACKNHNCPNNTICNDLQIGSYVCETIGCFEPQRNVSFLEPDLPLWPFGFKVLNPCQEGFYTNTSASCNMNGHWSDFECLPYPKNCTEVKNCNSSYDDGEYWLFYSHGVENKRIKIYCHNMTSNQPKEYVTLIHDNISSRSEYKYVDNTTCNVTMHTESYISAHGLGKVRFEKVRIYVTDLPFRVQNNDQTFTDKASFLWWGAAHDCLPQRDGCPARGEFTVDLRETSFTFSNQTAWKLFRTNIAHIDQIVWSSDNQVVEGRCGGFRDNKCAGCKFADMPYLNVNPDYQPDFNSAVLPVCNI